MKNKYVSFVFFTTFGIKATNKLVCDLNVTFGGENYKIHEIKSAGGAICPLDIEKTIDEEIKKTIPLFFFEDCFISEFKLNNANNDFYNVKWNEKDKADFVLKKKLKVKEIKFKDSNFKQYLKNNFTYEIKKIIRENKDFTYKTIFDAIKKIKDLFKTGQFGIKLNNLEDTEETPYKGDDKLNEGDEITVILDENKIEKNAFLKFIFEYDEDIFDLEVINDQFSRIFDTETQINELFPKYLIPNEFDIYKNDDNTPIKSSSNDPIPKDLNYFRIKLDKNNVRELLLKKDKKIQLSKKGCKIVNDDILKSIEETIKKSHNGKLLECFKESIFINEKIDKTMISIKNQDTSDPKIYSIDDAKIPAKIIIDLSPEAFIANQVKVVFEIKDVEKDGRKLKGDFKNKFKGKLLTLNYGEKKLNFINQLNKIIPGITEDDIKLNGQSLTDEIKEGGEIFIPVEKIPDENFEDKSKTEEEDKPKGTEEKGSGNNNGDNKKKNGYCGSNNK